MTQLKYFQPTTGSPATVASVSGTTITVQGTVAFVSGMSVANTGAGINTTITSVIGPNSFTVGSTTGITTSTPLTIGTWVSAVVGAQGYQGTAGSPGGAQGSQGNQGGLTVISTATLPPGSSAYVNNSGSPGNALLYFGIPSGYQGYQGYQGSQGYQSSVQGPQGYQGYQGFQGFQGYQSSVQGPQGIQGNQGNQGYQGYQGYQGSVGLQGYQGNQGYQGAQGYQSGVQGYQGYQGYQGSQGLQGSQGYTGAQGSQGVVSGTNPPIDTSLLWLNPNALATNFTGPQGAQGAQGLTGAGTQGAQGSPGGTLPAIFLQITSGQTSTFSVNHGNKQFFNWDTSQTSSNANSPTYNASLSGSSITINQTGYYNCTFSLYGHPTLTNNFFAIGLNVDGVNSYYLNAVALTSGQSGWAGGASALLISSGSKVYPFYTFDTSNSGTAGNPGGGLNYLNIASCSITYISAP